MWAIGETNDTSVLEAAYEWYKEIPEWLRSRSLAEEAGDLESFIRHFEGDLLFYGDGGEAGDALVVGTRIAEGTHEGHLFCKRGSDPDFVQAVIMFAKHWTFRYTDSVRILSVLRTKHFGLKKLMYGAGFTPSGYSLWDSAAENGKVFEGQLFVAYRHKM